MRTHLLIKLKLFHQDTDNKKGKQARTTRASFFFLMDVKNRTRTTRDGHVLEKQLLPYL